jgi:S-adenosylmethionine/arginine decarboxylase-like enzyme
MTVMDVLAYGTHLVFDGTRADPFRLADRNLVTHVTLDLARLLGDVGTTDPVVIEDSDGVSAGISLAEAAVSIHAFPGLGTLCLDVFSVRRPKFEAIYRPVEEAFAVGRSTSRRAARARAPRPDDPEGLARRLRGERAYAEARFTDLRAFGGS